MLATCLQNRSLDLCFFSNRYPVLENTPPRTSAPFFLSKLRGQREEKRDNDAKTGREMDVEKKYKWGAYKDSDGDRE